jgi:hypothetical protein
VTVGHVEAQPLASGCQTVDVAVDHRMKVGQHVTIEAGASITLKVGSTFLLIDHNGITLRGENRVTAMTHEFAALDIHHADAELRDAHGATVKLHGGFVRLNS